MTARGPRCCVEVDRQDNDGPYRADWETLRKFEMPQWYKDAKFGIFIHWGALAVSGAVNEWYPRNMYQEADPAFQEHRKLYGPQDKFGYKDLVPLFKARSGIRPTGRGFSRQRGRVMSSRSRSITTASRYTTQACRIGRR
jgi:hypothetical protein